ncbi:MAG TPA: membrane dipeptidase [Nitriliruptorales bacterium]
MSEVFARYDFGLDEDQEERARKLHERSVVVDALHQGPLGYRDYPQAMVEQAQEAYAEHGEYRRAMDELGRALQDRERETQGAASRERLAQAGLTGITREVFFFDARAALSSFASVIDQFDRLPWLVKALRAEDFVRAKDQGLHAGFVNTQWPDGLVDDPAIVDVLHGLGLRMFQLTYNVMNGIGAGCTERTDAGVSRLGARFIERMNQVGVIVDTGHCGHQTTLDACEVSTAPVIASHTAAAAVYEHDRGKSDEEIRALAGTGGVIGVVAVPFFLSGDVEASIETILDHIDHIAGLVGPQHVAIGTDWPMQHAKWTLRELMPPWTRQLGFDDSHGLDMARNLVGFDDIRDYPNITRGLVARGYTDDDIEGILGGNFLRVFEQVCG